MVNNFEFFLVVDHLVREAMKTFETRLLPAVQQTVKVTGVPLGKYPVEGYYNETPELTAFLQFLRSLQNNKAAGKVSDETLIRKLDSIYAPPTLGLGRTRPSYFHEEPDIDLPGVSKACVVISPLADVITLAVSHVAGAGNLERLSVGAVMQATEEYDLGENLVALAVAVDRTYAVDGVFNPVATAAACETTVSSRESTCLGIPGDLGVDKEIYELGSKVADHYNRMFAEHPEGHGLSISVKPDVIRRQNHLLSAINLMGRVVCLADNQVSGMAYHWGIRLNLDDETPGYYQGLEVEEVLQRGVLTTAEYGDRVLRDVDKSLGARLAEDGR